MKFDLAKMLAEIGQDEKKPEAESGKKVLTQAEIKALAKARRAAAKAAAK